MKTSKGSVLLFVFLLLALTAVSGLAWKFYNQSRHLALQAAGLQTELDGLRKTQANDAKMIKQLQDRIASLRTRRTNPDDATAADGAAGGPPGQDGRRNRFAAMQAVMSSPEFQKLQALQIKAGLDARYAALFKNLNLSPQQLDQLKNLLVDRQQTVADALQAARDQGVNPRSDPQDFRQAVQQAQAAVDDQIKAALGDAGYAQYQQYNQTLPQRNMVTQLQQSLSYTSAPLNDDQANQLVQLMAQAQAQNAQNNPGANGGGGGGRGGFGGAQAMVFAGGAALGGGTSEITDQVITQAQSFLSQQQVQALQQLQQQQQAQRQMGQLMRSAMQASSGNRGGGN